MKNKKTKQCSIFFVVAIVMIVIFFSFNYNHVNAQIPNFINYQGKLKDNTGNPITTATTIQFSLYNNISNGSPSDTPGSGGPLLWTEIYDGSGGCAQITPGADGIFAQHLGDCVPFPTYLDFTQEYYLGVKIGSDAEAVPRVSFATNPYAFTSKSVHTENEDINIDTETSGNIMLNSAGNIQLQANDITSAFIVDQQGTGNLFELQNNGTTAFIVQNNGFVGIGTATPTQRLHVSGNFRLEGALYDSNNSSGSNGQILMSLGTTTSWIDASSLSAGSLWDGDHDTGIQVEKNPDEDIIRFDTLGGQRAKIDNAGNVLFSNLDPADLLNPGALAGLLFRNDKASMRIGEANNNEWNDANIGNGSFASGRNNVVSGNYSTALGGSNDISDVYSVAMGRNNTITSSYTVAGGYHNTIGSYAGMVFGQTNTVSDTRAAAWGLDNTASEREATAWGRNTEASAPYATSWGRNTVASGEHSTAFGYQNTASDDYGLAFGYSNTASGRYATVWGGQNTASGQYSTAFGSHNTASGAHSLAIGFYSEASAENGVAIGDALANSNYMIALGRFNENVAGQSLTNWVDTDQLFVIGNGTGWQNANRSNALTILKNGTITAPSFSLAEINTAGNTALTTKEYVDNAILSGTNSIYTTNGTLTDHRSLDGNGRELYFENLGLFSIDDQNGNSFQVDNGIALNSSSGNNINISDSIQFIGNDNFSLEIGNNTNRLVDNRNGINQVGLVYDADYSANYTNRSLVDKEYVDEQLMWEIINGGERIQPKNHSVRQIYVQEDSNSYTQFMVRNDNDTGNGAGAIIELKGSGADYTNNMYIGKYGASFWIPELQDNGAVLTDKNLVIGTASDTKEIHFVTGNSYTDLQPVVVADNEGFRYTSDLSATFVDRTLVDKAYVDGLVNSSSVTASNGLTKIGNDIQLGGDLDYDTWINTGHGKELFIGRNGDSYLRITGGAMYSIDVAQSLQTNYGPTKISFTNNNTGQDIILYNDSDTIRIDSDYNGFKGLTYTADYSANYTTRSLVDKEYVDNAILSGTNNIYITNGTLTGNRNVSLDGNNLVFSGSGNIGIGTTNPSYKLQINGNVRATRFHGANGTAGSPTFRFDSDADTGMFRAGTNQLAFTTNGSEALRVDSIGRVGIGVIAPDSLLQIGGNVHINKDLLVDDSEIIYTQHSYNDSTFGYEFNWNLLQTEKTNDPNDETVATITSGTGWKQVYPITRWKIGNEKENGQHYGYVGYFPGDNWKPLFRINTGGVADTDLALGVNTKDIINITASHNFVGIRTDAPTEVLDVAGNVRLRQELHDSNNQSGNMGQMLSSIGTGISWIDAPVSATGSIDTHSDVDTTTNTPSNNQVLSWNGANWVPATVALGNIYNIDGTLTEHRTVDLNNHNLIFDNAGVGTGEIHINSGLKWLELGETGTVAYIGSAYGGSSSNNHPLALRVGDNEYMRIDTNGNIGVGVNSPNYKLDVAGPVMLNDNSGTPVPSQGYAGIYTQTGELYAIDDNGNTTQLSPHDSEGDWWYNSTNINTGNTLTVQMELLTKEINKILGGGYITENGEEIDKGINQIEDLEKRVAKIEKTGGMLVDDSEDVIIDIDELLDKIDNHEERITNLEDLLKDTTNIEGDNGEEENNTSIIFTELDGDVRNILEEVSFKKGVEFDGDTTFFAKTIFADEVTFMNRIQFADKDMAGKVTIDEGKKKVKVEFKKEFTFKPYVTATVNNDFVLFKVTDVTEEGFKIEIEDEAQKDINFTWHALSVIDD